MTGEYEYLVIFQVFVNTSSSIRTHIRNKVFVNTSYSYSPVTPIRTHIRNKVFVNTSYSYSPVTSSSSRYAYPPVRLGCAVCLQVFVLPPGIGTSRNTSSSSSKRTAQRRRTCHGTPGTSTSTWTPPIWSGLSTTGPTVPQIQTPALLAPVDSTSCVLAGGCSTCCFPGTCLQQVQQYDKLLLY
jgi:hypothetical protein